MDSTDTAMLAAATGREFSRDAVAVTDGGILRMSARSISEGGRGQGSENKKISEQSFGQHARLFLRTKLTRRDAAFRTDSNQKLGKLA